MPCLRLMFLSAVCLAMTTRATAQDVPSVDDLIRQGRKFAEENLDDRVTKLIRGLESGDRAQVGQLAVELQREFGGDYVLDLPRLQRVAQALLPLLEEDRSTAPYAAWLRSRMDYFEVARELAAVPRPVPRTVPRPVAPVRTNAPGTVTVQVGTNAPTPPRPAPAPPQIATPTPTPIPVPVPVPVPAPVLIPEARPPNPSAPVQRIAWEHRTAGRPMPTGAARYVNRLKPIFAASGAPRELVWLAEVESGFEREARSPAGAVGMFQLMPQTAKGLGLRLTPRDERENPEQSARAAATYLKALHGRFHDWRLALAAYNAGEGRVQRTLEQHRVKTFDEVSPYLPAETQLYVPKVEAVIRHREGKRLAELRTV